jgi:hypothetical protein
LRVRIRGRKVEEGRNMWKKGGYGKEYDGERLRMAMGKERGRDE